MAKDASQQNGAGRPAAPPKLSWSEKREQRRRGRRRFEELLGWIIVPGLIYVGYLIYDAVGGIPPGVMAFLSEVFNSAASGSL